MLSKLLLTVFRRVKCGFVWDTPEGGPCLLTPVMPQYPGSPVWDEVSGRTKWDEPAIKGNAANPGTLSSECGTKSGNYIDDPMANWAWENGESKVSVFNQLESTVRDQLGTSLSL